MTSRHTDAGRSHAIAQDAPVYEPPGMLPLGSVSELTRGNLGGGSDGQGGSAAPTASHGNVP